MTMTYMDRRKAETPLGGGGHESRPAQGPSLEQLAAGAAPTQEQMGRQVDLPEAMRAKMEASFGADFSNVKLYESQTVADAGAQAVTRGSNVMFAPGQADFASSGGQALLGHELSHVVSQARGESRGVGFLRDAGLEAQADRQGAMAAAGETVYTGPVTPISSTSSALSASGPMQAKERDTKDAEEEAAREGAQLPGYLHPVKRHKAKKDYLTKRSNRINSQLEADRKLDDEDAELAKQRFVAQFKKGEAQKSNKTDDVINYDAEEKRLTGVANDRLQDRKNKVMENLETIEGDETQKSRFGTLSPMLQFLKDNDDIQLSVGGGAAMGYLENGKAKIDLNVGSGNQSNLGGLSRAQLIHESTHIRNTVAGHKAATKNDFAFSKNAIMESNGQGANTATIDDSVGSQYGKMVNEPRTNNGVDTRTVQNEVFGDMGEAFEANMRSSGVDEKRKGKVLQELKRIGSSITKVDNDPTNMAEASAYLNQMMYLCFENQDLFKDSFYKTDQFKALQHYTGFLNDESNYQYEKDEGSVKIKDMMTYAQKKEQEKRR